MQQNKFIAIEGVIGVGKTTLARLLGEKLNGDVLLEVFEENPFLADFYGDRARYAFQTQIFFLLSRYNQQIRAVPDALAKRSLISDYTFAKDELFAWLNLKDDELAMYGKVHAALGEKMRQPDLLVYLHADHDTVMKRIALRDRPYERNMDPDYIRQLAQAYEMWLSQEQETAVLRIDVTDLDFLSREEDVQHVVNKIVTALAEQPAPPSHAVNPLPTELLANGRLAPLQQFHEQLDIAKGFNTDLFANYLYFSEEMGEVATELTKVWEAQRRMVANGRLPHEALNEALAAQQESLASELADMLAYTFKLANYANIDLEQAYRDKMQKNLRRQWR